MGRDVQLPMKNYDWSRSRFAQPFSCRSFVLFSWLYYIYVRYLNHFGEWYCHFDYLQWGKLQYRLQKAWPMIEYFLGGLGISGEHSPSITTALVRPPRKELIHFSVLPMKQYDKRLNKKLLKSSNRYCISDYKHSPVCVKPGWKNRFCHVGTYIYIVHLIISCYITIPLLFSFLNIYIYIYIYIYLKVKQEKIIQIEVLFLIVFFS